MNRGTAATRANMNSNASPACCAAEKMAVHFCEGPHPGDPRRRAIDSRTASAAGPSMRTICVLVSSRFDPSFFSRCAVVLPSLDSRPNCSQVPLDSANWFSDQWGPSSAIQATLGLKRHCQLDRRHPNPHSLATYPASEVHSADSSLEACPTPALRQSCCWTPCITRALIGQP